VYCITLRQLHRIFHNEVHRTQTADIRCSAARTWAGLGHFIWELFDHPPYTTDLDPCEYHLFAYLMNWLRWQRFSNKGQLIKSVKTWLRSKTADLYDTSIHVENKPEVCTYILCVVTIFPLLAQLTAHRMLLSEWPSYISVMWLTKNTSVHSSSVFFWAVGIKTFIQNDLSNAWKHTLTRNKPSLQRHELLTNIIYRVSKCYKFKLSERNYSLQI
jgi:hypothetical protein